MKTEKEMEEIERLYKERDALKAKIAACKDETKPLLEAEIVELYKRIGAKWNAN